MVTSRKLKQQAKFFARGGAASALAFAPNFIVLISCQLDRFGATYHFGEALAHSGMNPDRKDRLMDWRFLNEAGQK